MGDREGGVRAPPSRSRLLECLVNLNSFIIDSLYIKFMHSGSKIITRFPSTCVDIIYFSQILNIVAIPDGEC